MYFIRILVSNFVNINSGYDHYYNAKYSLFWIENEKLKTNQNIFNNTTHK